MTNEHETPADAHLADAHLNGIFEGLRKRGMSRRQALRVMASAGVGVLAGPLLSRSAQAVTGPAGLPLARPGQPVKLPTYQDPIADGLKPESGTFRIFNYPDYLNKALIDKFAKKYDVDVSVTTFMYMDQAITKLANGSVDVDVTEITPDRMSQATVGRLLQPINHSYVPNLEANVWPQLHSPFYDVGAQYTVPYTCYTTGIGWRSDKIQEDVATLDNPWQIFWQDNPAYAGKVGLLWSSRETLGLGMLQRGNYRINSEDPDLIARSLADLQALPSVRVDQKQYQSLPQGTSWLHQAWSGDLLLAAFWYLPEGQSADVLQYWAAPKGKGPIQNDCWAVPAMSQKPVLAHLWMNFMLDEQNAYDNFIHYTGYQPPINGISRERLISEGKIPPHLGTAMMGPDDFGPESIQYMTLTVEGQRLWQDAFAKFMTGIG